MSSPRKIYTGIGLDSDLVEFLAELAHAYERPRSWVINAIVREKAASLREERKTAAAEASRRHEPIISL